MELSTEQITALAPDPASAKAGRGLMNPGKWPALGRSEEAEALWGECQGSGKDPYQVSVDLAGLASKCSCPSRKFPCKHGLALMYMAVEKPASLAAGMPPAWTADWLANRREKAEKKAAAPPAAEKKPVDAEAAAKRSAKRLDRMQEGGAELARWVADQVRSGIATLPQQAASTFKTVAARMVDAQVPGLSVEMARLEGQLHNGPEWPRRTLAQLGRMHYITEGLSRYETLPPPLQSDLRATLGWTMDKEELVASQPPVVDNWCIVGQGFTEHERLWERRTWLIGRQTRNSALVLDFSHGSRNFPIPLIPGSEVEAAVIFFPSATPLRAILLESPTRPAPSTEPFPTFEDIAAAFARITEALAANPWLHQAPLALENVTPYRTAAGAWAIRDRAGAQLPLNLADLDAWSLLAISGGQPLRVFGEWTAGALQVYGAWTDRFHPFTWTTYDE